MTLFINRIHKTFMKFLKSSRFITLFYCFTSPFPLPKVFSLSPLFIRFPVTTEQFSNLDLRYKQCVQSLCTSSNLGHDFVKLSPVCLKEMKAPKKWNRTVGIIYLSACISQLRSDDIHVIISRLLEFIVSSNIYFL